MGLGYYHHHHNTRYISLRDHETRVLGNALRVRSSHSERTTNKKHSKTRFILASGFCGFIQNIYKYKVLAKNFLGNMFMFLQSKGSPNTIYIYHCVVLVHFIVDWNVYLLKKFSKLNIVLMRLLHFMQSAQKFCGLIWGW